MTPQTDMNSKSDLLNFLVLLTFIKNGKADKCLNIWYDMSRKGFRLQKQVLMSKIVVQKIDCLMDCAADECCRSINYKKISTSQNETNCEMLHDIVSHDTFDNMLKKNSAFDYVYLIKPEKKYDDRCISNDLKVPNGSGFTSCNFIKLMKKGCYKDQEKTRTLPTRLETYPRALNWNESWHDSLYNVTCYCAKQAKNGGHRFFGVQAFKECWVGELTPGFFETKAKAKGKANCWGVKPNFQECSDHVKTKCVGRAWHNYIYEIIPDAGLP